MNLRTEPGILNTGASLLADLNLLAYVLILVPLMIVGFLYARRRMFEPQHKLIMTTITLLNWLLIIFVMMVSFTESVAPQIPDGLDDRIFLIPTIHLVTGGLAQLLATYLVIRMWFEKSLPGAFKVKNIKFYMRVTLSLWVVTAVLGILLYFTWYAPIEAQASDGETPSPVATEEANSDPITTEEPEAESSEPDPVTTEEAGD